MYLKSYVNMIVIFGHNIGDGSRIAHQPRDGKQIRQSPRDGKYDLVSTGNTLVLRFPPLLNHSTLQLECYFVYVEEVIRTFYQSIFSEELKQSCGFPASKYSVFVCRPSLCSCIDLKHIEI